MRRPGAIEEGEVYTTMPNAVPAESAAALPPARMIDPRGHRFGAAVSGGLLIVSFLFGWVPGVLLALLFSLLAFGLGATTLGWILALGVAGLQTVLAATGYCLGCRLYFLRWWIPDVVTSIWTRGARRQVIESQPIRFG